MLSLFPTVEASLVKFFVKFPLACDSYLHDVGVLPDPSEIGLDVLLNFRVSCLPCYLGSFIPMGRSSPSD